MIERVGTGLYAACVDFMLAIAALFGITYRDANALLFFIVWPLITIVLFAVVVAQSAALRRLGRSVR